MPHQHLGPYGREFVAVSKHKHLGIAIADGYLAVTASGEQSHLEYNPSSATPWTYTVGGVRSAHVYAPERIQWPQDGLTGQRNETHMFRQV